MLQKGMQALQSEVRIESSEEISSTLSLTSSPEACPAHTARPDFKNFLKFQVWKLSLDYGVWRKNTEPIAKCWALPLAYCSVGVSYTSLGQIRPW